MNVKDYTGQTFGRLLAVERIRKGKRTYYKCRCSCGNETVVRSDALVSSRKGNKTRSCGCIKVELNQSKGIVPAEDQGTRLHNIYKGMKGRCYTTSASGYEDYGGRGITVCQEWLDSFTDFKEWALSNGYRDDLTLDREDNDGDYEPSNCRWVDLTVQANNRRPRKYFRKEEKVDDKNKQTK